MLCRWVDLTVDTGSAARERERRRQRDLTIKVPNASSTQSTERRPQYVSPATQSMTVAISGPTDVNETANLTPTSSGCASTLASTLCTLTKEPRFTMWRVTLLYGNESLRGEVDCRTRSASLARSKLGSI